MIMNRDGPKFSMQPIEAVAGTALGEVYTYWDRLRAGRIGPRRQEIDPAALKDHLADLLILEVEADPLGFRYRLAGTRNTHIHGFELTGLRVDQLKPAAVAAKIQRQLELVVESRRPQLQRLEFINHDNVPRDVHVLRLPLSDDGETVDHILVCTKFPSAFRPGPDSYLYRE